jgi:hypothetical protein
MRVEARRLGHLLDCPSAAVRADAAIEDIVITGLMAIPSGMQIAFAIERRVRIPNAGSADSPCLGPTGGTRVRRQVQIRFAAFVADPDQIETAAAGNQPVIDVRNVAVCELRARRPIAPIEHSLE